MSFHLSFVLAWLRSGARGALSVPIVLFALHLSHGVSNGEGFACSFSGLLQYRSYFFIAPGFGYSAGSKRRKQHARITFFRLAAVAKAVTEIAHEMKLRSRGLDEACCPP
ncbi:MAG: hypothetical protein CVU64_11315 [Deltaproteobacteria bacterium HGW-Deltaproteobacteria-21]|nr:MAG: hypothetical protein CVU64_11315 [Deltaproteobacteria bacterium HGW-Deltaproteobacteria-21]